MNIHIHTKYSNIFTLYIMYKMYFTNQFTGYKLLVINIYRRPKKQVIFLPAITPLSFFFDYAYFIIYNTLYFRLRDTEESTFKQTFKWNAHFLKILLILSYYMLYVLLHCLMRCTSVYFKLLSIHVTMMSTNNNHNHTLWIFVPQRIFLISIILNVQFTGIFTTN